MTFICPLHVHLQETSRNHSTSFETFFATRNNNDVNLDGNVW